MTNPEWISQGAEALAWNRLKRAGEDVDFDVVIVGSGYGGAVAAYKLAGARRDGKEIAVAVLERGFEYVPGTFPERFADLPGYVRVNSVGEAPGARNRHGLFDIHVGEVTSLVGNGLGGGSLINAGVLAEPTPETFTKPGWPASISSEVLAPHFRKVRDALGAARMPGSQLPEKFRALERLARGYKDGQGAPARAECVEVAVTFKKAKTFAGVEQNPCIACGNCVSGCNHQAKNTLATNYLPAAFRRGASLYTGVTVERLSRGADGSWNVHWGFTDAQVADRFDSLHPGAVQKTAAKDKVRPPAIRARRVILAAGTYGSTEILLRSRADPEDPASPPEAIALSGALGTKFSTNGENIVIAYGTGSVANASAREENDPNTRSVGPTIVGMIDRRRAASGYVVQEFGIPAPLRRVFEETSTTTGLLHSLGKWDSDRHDDRTGQDPLAVEDKKIDRTPVFGFIGHDDSRGTLRLKDRKKGELLGGALTADWGGLPRPADDPYFLEPYREVQAAHKKSKAGGVVIPSPLWKVLPDTLDGVLSFESGGALITTHPLGGCPMADDAAQGVVNAVGQVYRVASGKAVYDTLVVLDGSIVPSSLGINPSLTIAALASHALDALCGKWGLTPLDEAALPNPLPPMTAVQPRNSWEQEKRPTAATYAEVFKGELAFGAPKDAARSASRPLDATLDLQFAPIKDLWNFTRRMDRHLDVKRGTLWLTVKGPPQPVAVEVPVSGSLNLLVREATNPLCRILRSAWAWLRNRGWREFVEFTMPDHVPGVKQKQTRDMANPLKLLRALVATWNNAGERRLFEYALTVEKDANVRGLRVLDAGDRIVGRKLIAYEHMSNPWTQSNRLSVEFMNQAGVRKGSGTFIIDPVFAVRDHAVQLQLTGQQDQPSALADLFSFSAFLARVIFKIHFYTFRAPYYPDDAERQKENKRIRDHVEARRDKPDRFKCFDKTRMPAAVGSIEPHVTWHQMKPAPLPGQKKDLADPSETVDPVDLGLSPGYFVLSHYPGKAGSAPMLLIHGFGASGSTFTTDTVPNLGAHLLARNHDVWVIDLPTSIAMGASHVEWAFERASRAIGEALEHICAGSGGRKVNVVAHCIGGAMFLMSVLDKKSKVHQLVNAAVLSQSGPIVRVPPLNRLRGFIAGYLKAFLNSAAKAEFDVTSELTTTESMIDRLLVAYPYEPHEWKIYNPLLPCLALDNEAYFHRANAIWGKLFEVTNIGPATRRRLGDLIGHVNARAMQQTVLFMHLRRVCDVLGENTFVTTKQVAESLRFPVCLIHGRMNAVFEAEGAEESFRFIARARGLVNTLEKLDAAPDEQAKKAIYESSWSLRLILQDGYGHQDLVIGDVAHQTVFPQISAFFEQAAAQPALETGKATTIARFPRLGPVLGALVKPANVPGAPHHVKVLVIADDLESDPEYAVAIVVADGEVQPALSIIDPSRNEFEDNLEAWNNDEQASLVIDRLGYYGNAPRRTWTLNVALPRNWTDLRIYCVTLHEEHPDTAASMKYGSATSRADPSRLAFEPKFPFPVELRSGASTEEVVAALRAVKGGGAGPDERLVREWADLIVKGCRERVAFAESIRSDESVADPTYQWQMPYCKLAPSMLTDSAAGDGRAPDAVAFAMGSCRYAASIFDRELADRSFKRLRASMERAGDGRPKPQFLLLIGDQIYADATAGVFDPTVGVERYDWMYHEAWSSPHARAVLRSLPTYMMLDDHELSDNLGDYHCSTVTRAEIAPVGNPSRRVVVHSIVSSGFYAPYPFANADLARMARSWSGRLSDWYAAVDPLPADVNVAYQIVAETDRDGFATIAVRKSASAPTYELDVRFDTDDEKDVYQRIDLK